MISSQLSRQPCGARLHERLETLVHIVPHRFGEPTMREVDPLHARAPEVRVHGREIVRLDPRLAYQLVERTAAGLEP